METAPNFRFEREYISPNDWERLLLAGWDRVGTGFFHRRFDYKEVGFENGEPIFEEKELMPLRYDLANFELTASQKKTLRKNGDLQFSHGPADLTAEKLELFARWHQTRFGFESSIFDWVSPENKPFPSHELCFRKNGKLLAASFFDRTPNCQYSTTAFFDPEESCRRLGILTLLAELLLAIQSGKRFHFPGHAYRNRSIYDYKKMFVGMEAFDWDTKNWLPLERLSR